MKNLRLTLVVSAALATLSVPATLGLGHVAASTAAPTVAAADLAAIQLGRAIFFDPSLSGSGKLSCAGCHDPAYAYGPPNARAVQLGGATMHTAGLRAVPSLRYTLARTPIWHHTLATSFAEQIREKDNVPTGGLAWDGRFNTLHEQAAFPLLTPTEMAGSKPAMLLHLRHAPYAGELRRIFGADVLNDPDRAFTALRQAIEAFELGDPSFHPYTSRYDAWLDGKTTLTAQEQRGLALFNDVGRGNCAGCHISQRGVDGAHPLFTDYQFEALAVPRNREVPANRDPAFYDLGLCGPQRTDFKTRADYCGMFKTPTLRNVAARRVFFHNGRFHTLKQALEFYVDRDRHPEHWYGPRGAYDDLPKSLQANVDRTTLPLTGRRGEPPVWNAAEIDDVVAFLTTLNDADVKAPR